MKRIWLSVLLTVSCVGCSTTAVPDPDSAEESIAPTGGPVEVAIDFEVERDSLGQLRISGETNLPNETRMLFSLSQPATNFRAQDSGQVQSGRFESAWFSRQGASLSARVYEIDVTVPYTRHQPRASREGHRLGHFANAATQHGVIALIVTGPHDANRQDPHLPMRYDAGRPRAVIRFRMLHARTTSVPRPAGLHARRRQPGRGGPGRANQSRPGDPTRNRAA